MSPPPKKTKKHNGQVQFWTEREAGKTPGQHSSTHHVENRFPAMNVDADDYFA